MNKEILHNLLADLAISYRIIANDKDKIRLSKYHQALNDFLIDYEILQSKIDKAIEYIEEHTDKLGKIKIPKIDFNYNELSDILREVENVENN